MSVTMATASGDCYNVTNSHISNVIVKPLSGRRSTVDDSATIFLHLHRFSWLCIILHDQEEI